MKTRVRMDELTWIEYQERITAGAPVILVCASTEQHGPHLPLGTDVMQALEVADRAARQVGALVAPPLAYGYKSQPDTGGGQSFPGTTSLDAETLILLVRDILKEFIRHGVRGVALVDAHFENTWFLIEAIDLALRESRASEVKILHLPITAFISEETIKACFPDGFPGWDTEHAAVLETSWMAVARPDLVRWEKMDAAPLPQRRPAYHIYPTPPDVVSGSGCLADPTGSSQEKGELIVARAAYAIATLLANEFGLEKPGEGIEE